MGTSPRYAAKHRLQQQQTLLLPPCHFCPTSSVELRPNPTDSWPVGLLFDPGEFQDALSRLIRWHYQNENRLKLKILIDAGVMLTVELLQQTYFSPLSKNFNSLANTSFCRGLPNRQGQRLQCYQVLQHGSISVAIIDSWSPQLRRGSPKPPKVRPPFAQPAAPFYGISLTRVVHDPPSSACTS